MTYGDSGSPFGAARIPSIIRLPDAIATMPLKFELLQADDYSRYLLREKTDILYNLRALMQKRAMLSAFIDASADSFLSAILAVSDGRTSYLVLDAASDPKPSTSRVEESEQLICVTQLDKIKIQFAAHGASSASPTKGHDAFRTPVPDVLLRLQRREYYRLTAPNPHTLSCQIPVILDEAKARSFQCRGRRRRHQRRRPGGHWYRPMAKSPFEPDMEFADCRLMLPETGPIATSLRVRNLFRITNRDGSIMLRAGCEFVDLPASMASTIQRYILKAERERNARERIR
jgi:c-di-GMP-binding flagellar brake protein YcgR